MGLEHLFDRCPVLPVDASISLARYLHSARQTIMQAASSERSGDLERAALLQIRVLQLICKTVVAHPEYQLPENGPLVTQFRHVADSAFADVERLSDALESRAGPKSSESRSASARRPRTRKVEVSSNLIDVFERIAGDNSANGLETIGILAGPLDGSVAPLQVTALIIPSQSCTQHGSEMRYENDVFSLQELKGLASMGWIQMRPQDSRLTLSPSAARTHAGFQIMMPEAVVIVVAPGDPSRYRAYALTDPGGLGYVLGCASRETPLLEKVVPPGLSGAGRAVSAPAKHVIVRLDGIPAMKLYDLRSLGAARDAQGGAAATAPASAVSMPTAPVRKAV